MSRCGYGCVERGTGGLRVVAAGVITTAGDLPLPERLAEVARELRGLVDELRPSAVAVERVLFQSNARTAMSVGQASGLALVAAAEAGCPVHQYSANEVKCAVAGYGAASKAQVQEMVTVVLGLPSPPRPPDVADALALAICEHTMAPWRRSVSAAAGGGVGAL